MLTEILVVSTALTVLIVDLFLTERTRWLTGLLTLLGLLGALAAAFSRGLYGQALGGRFVVEPVAWWFDILLLLATFVCVILSMDVLNGNLGKRQRGLGSPAEYYTILLFTLAGMMFLISSRDLITFYVSLELATVPMFALAAWRRDDPRSGEAGLKYVILAALSSSLIVYGMALLYGLTGQTNLDAIGRTLPDHIGPAFWFAVAMLVAGAGSKFTVVPFHLWAADVYHGAPTPITAYLSVASKCVGLGFMFQVMFRIFGGWLHYGGPLVAIFAATTMTLGNTVAIVQHDIKRFMAFSAISQAGYFLLGFLGPHEAGVAAMLFYMLVYIASNLGVFTCIIWFQNETGLEEIEDYRGLSRRNPLMALMMMIALFSLAGIPPLSGFVGKFFLFSIASRAGYHWLVALAAVNSTISLYYYLRVVRQMYIEPPDTDAKALPVTWKLAITEAVLLAAVVTLGILPNVYERIHADTVTWLATLVR